MDYKKIIIILTIDVENAKHEYDVVDIKSELKKCFDDLKSKNEALRLELENKCKALDESLNETDALKMSMSEKVKHTSHMQDNRHSRTKHAHITCYECGRKCHIAFYYSFKKKHYHFKKI